MIRVATRESRVLSEELVKATDLLTKAVARVKAKKGAYLKKFARWFDGGSTVKGGVIGLSQKLVKKALKTFDAKTKKGMKELDATVSNVNDVIVTIENLLNGKRNAYLWRAVGNRHLGKVIQDAKSKKPGRPMTEKTARDTTKYFRKQLLEVVSDLKALKKFAALKRGEAKSK